MMLSKKKKTNKSNIKGNRGKAQRTRELNKLVIVFSICIIVIALYEITGMGGTSRNSRRKKNSLRSAAKHHSLDMV